MAKITFITGGARSGKSAFALKEALKIAGRKAYVATCEPLDDEMRLRVEAHKAQRGQEWATFEETITVPELVKEIGQNYEAILLDCLTIWTSNLLLSGLITTEADAEGAAEALSGAIDACGCGSVFVVSNEVGMGIVPENELARRFRDLAGTINKKIAAVSSDVYLLVSGLPVKLKGD